MNWSRLSLKLLLVAVFAAGMFAVGSAINPTPVSASCESNCLHACGSNPNDCCGCSCGQQQAGECGGGGPPPCSNSYPTAPTLLNPAQGYVAQNSNVYFSWSVGAWGYNCGGNVYNSYLYISEQVAGVCNGYASYYGGGGLSATVPLPWGKTYCYYVQANNNGLASNSVIRTFSIVKTPVLLNSGFDPNSINKCASAISGRLENTGKVNNPITFYATFYDERNDFAAGVNVFRNFRIGVISDAQENNPTVTAASLEPKLAAFGGFQVTNLTTTPTFTAVDSASNPFYGSSKTTGDLLNVSGTAKLLGLNTPTGTRLEQIDNQTMRITWQIEFENSFPTADMNIYVMGVSQTADGTQVSQSATATQAVVFGKAADWEVDTQEPPVTIGSPQLIGPTQFTINWQASDATTGNNGITTFQSYCFTDVDTVTIQDQGLGQQIVMQNTELDYPNPANCLVTAANLGVHTYDIIQYNPLSGMFFRGYAEDSACNASRSIGYLENTSPWVVTFGGSTSVLGGFSRFKIRSVDLSTIVPNYSGMAYLSTYSAISGTDETVPSRHSLNNYHAEEYQDLAVSPPSIGGAASWYEYLYQLMTTGGQSVHDVGTQTVTSNISTNMGVATGAAGLFRVTGDLTLNSGSKCDLRAVIFVSGKMTVNPDFTRNTDQGCVFIVAGDLEVQAGTNKAGGYDLVYGVFIVSDTLRTAIDANGDNLYFEGAVMSKALALGREGTGLVPGEAFRFDPFYADTFGSILSVRKFSLRER